jgi:hypothetical protein
MSYSASADRERPPPSLAEMSTPRSIHIRPLTVAALAVVVASVVVAVAYFSMGHTKHGIAFLGLAVLAGIGTWFTSAPAREAIESGRE